MMVESGRWSLSCSVWHMSSVTLTSKPKPVPSVCLCSVSDRATWTSEALHDAGTHSAQWIAEERGTRCPGWRWRSASCVSPQERADIQEMYHHCRNCEQNTWKIHCCWQFSMKCIKTNTRQALLSPFCSWWYWEDALMVHIVHCTNICYL
jgi:hypothetical protein